MAPTQYRNPRFLLLALSLLLLSCITRGAAPPPSSSPNRVEYGDLDAFSQRNSNPQTDAYVGIDTNMQAPLDTTSEDALVVPNDIDEQEDPPAPEKVCADPLNCPCKDTVDCEYYDKKDLCSGVHLCIEGGCVLQESSAVSCPEHFDPCKGYGCDPDFGLCIEFDKVNGAPCDDGEPCTENDICLAKECMGSAVVCDDDNPCTNDSCELGVCEAQSTCDDDDPCTEDSCSDDGNCLFIELVCDDGDACTSEDCQTDNGGCVYTKVLCSDGDSCTDDLCLPESGCSFPDNGSCTVDFAMVDLEIFQKKCVPCHTEEGPKRSFVGQAAKMKEIPQLAQCQNLPGDLPYTLAGCIYWLTTQSLSMPPPWFQAETLLPDTWNQTNYTEVYVLTEEDRQLLEDWANQGFSQ